jgi:hypothetical protein
MSVCEQTRLSAADIELLAHHLSEEKAAQEEVLRGLIRQERLLVTNDAAGLRQLLVESDPTLARLQALTGMRMRIMGLIAKRLGVAAEACTLETVLEDLDGPDRARLASQAAELRKVIREVVLHTRRVNVLLRHASDTNQVLLHALLGEDAPLRPYLPDGQRAPSTGLSRFARDF